MNILCDLCQDPKQVFEITHSYKYHKYTHSVDRLGFKVSFMLLRLVVSFKSARHTMRMLTSDIENQCTMQSSLLKLPSLF